MNSILHLTLRWIHLVATVSWIGGMFTNLFIYIPAIGKTLEPPAAGRLMGTVMRRFRIMVYISMAVFLISGILMGSKNLKAVACSGSLKPDIHDKPEVSRLVKEMMAMAKSNPSGMYLGLSSTGTPGAMIPHMAEHDVPIKNWSGNFVEDFPEEKWGNVAWDGMEKYAVKK